MRRVMQAQSGTFAALALPEYRLLWLTGVFSFFAVQTQIIARGWLAFDLTGSNTGLGGVYLGFGIPMLLATPWGGVAADRLSKRRVMIFSQTLLAISAAWVAAAVAFDFIEYWMLVVASSVQAVAFAFFGPARMAFTGELAGREMLPNAVILGQMSLNASRVVGPAMAGVLIGVPYVGVAGVYFLSLALVLVGTAITVVRLPPGEPAPGRPVRTPGAELADGLRYVRARPDLLLLIVTSFLVVMIAFPYIAFLPAVADGLFDVGSTGYGAMSAVSAVGALGVSFFIAGRAGGSGAWRLQTAAGIVFGASVLLLGLAPNFIVALVVIFVVGAGASAFQAMNNSLVLSLSDLDYHGRTQSLMMLSISGFGMAALPLGVLADAIGLRPTLVIMGVVALAAMGAFLSRKGHLERLEGPMVPPV